MSALQAGGLLVTGRPLRLHLGCGQVHLDGYVNVDYPPAEHTVQTSSAADVFADITALRFPPGSVAEVRLHHVFEHFNRPTALALLCHWQIWLGDSGLLVIETPDLQASIEELQSDDLSYADKQVVIRHIFGSHEANWAVHYDGWYTEKYQHVLGELGYEILSATPSAWEVTRNITVRARPCQRLSTLSLRSRAIMILSESLLSHVGSERTMLDVWNAQFDRVFPQPVGLQPASAPVLSIFMPVYNRERYLPETLDSLLNQSFRDFEVIIADDGSTDGTLAVAQAYADRDARIRVLALAHHGEVAARNAALLHIHPGSRYLMNHDSDDISLPGKLERLVTYLDANPAIAVVGCLAEYFDDSGKTLGRPEIYTHPADIRRTFGRTNSMINSAALIRREVMMILGGYREAFRSADDYDFFARALMAGFTLENLPVCLHRTRLHQHSVSAENNDLQRRMASKVGEEYKRWRLSKSVPARIKRRVKRWFIRVNA